MKLVSGGILGLFKEMSVISFFELPFWIIKIFVAIFSDKRIRNK